MRNKLLTRDNLLKRQHVADPTCLFCNEAESVNHLFFNCVVARELWREIFSPMGCNIELNSHGLLEWWARNDNKTADIMLHAAALWALWRYRNDIYFNDEPWLGMQVMWQKTASFLTSWEIKCADTVQRRCRLLVQRMEHLARAPPLLLWPDHG